MRPPVITPYNEPKKAKSRETQEKPVKRAGKKKAIKYESSALHSLYIDYTTRRNKVILNQTK